MGAEMDDTVGLRALLAAAAAEAGRPVDVDAIVRALLGSVRAFTRRHQAADPLPAAARRRRYRVTTTAAHALADALAALGRDGRAALGCWCSEEEYGALAAALERLAGRAEAVADRPARRGGRRHEATRMLVLEAAWVLGRAGLPVTTYEAGLLARVARAVADLAGRRLPEDENIRTLLRPAVRFCRRQGVGESTAGERFLHLTEIPAPPAPSVQTRRGVVAH